ncbi:hypothetical protein AVEN_118426-1 [Araneus ventricosus]|uniref:Uncharacterized protein n=1 Tax=Araneus ventricosus TaxID=182803 RepID=A0A4Y2L751_ARAVE|nr:hypothetical protein AVEN_118426-1 [Araneus ventricosus]
MKHYRISRYESVISTRMVSQIFQSDTLRLCIRVKLNDSRNSSSTEAGVPLAITGHGPIPPERGTYYHWRRDSRPSDCCTPLQEREAPYLPGVFSPGVLLLLLIISEDQQSYIRSMSLCILRSPSSHNRLWPDPSRRMYVLSLEEQLTPSSLLYSRPGARTRLLIRRLLIHVLVVP